MMHERSMEGVRQKPRNWGKLYVKRKESSRERPAMGTVQHTPKRIHWGQKWFLNRWKSRIDAPEVHYSQGAGIYESWVTRVCLEKSSEEVKDTSHAELQTKVKHWSQWLQGSPSYKGLSHGLWDMIATMTVLNMGFAYKCWTRILP